MTQQYKNKVANICWTNKRILGEYFVRAIIFSLKLLFYGVFQVFYVLIWSRLWGKMASRGRKGTSSKNEDGSDNVDGSIPQAILDVRRHHKQAYAFINKALSIDESAGRVLLDKDIIYFNYLALKFNYIKFIHNVCLYYYKSAFKLVPSNLSCCHCKTVKGLRMSTYGCH